MENSKCFAKRILSRRAYVTAGLTYLVGLKNKIGITGMTAKWFHAPNKPTFTECDHAIWCPNSFNVHIRVDWCIGNGRDRLSDRKRFGSFAVATAIATATNTPAISNPINRRSIRSQNHHHYVLRIAVERIRLCIHISPLAARSSQLACEIKYNLLFTA